MMEPLPQEPPVIAPVLETARPQWSVMIPVYNCAAFLPQTLESVLQQAPAETAMQIEVVDDASTDADIKAMVAQIGKGRILYFRQSENVGSLKNFETCLHRARGHIIHLLHGDDKVLPGYYTKMEALFARWPEAGAAFCRYDYIDEAGNFLQHPTAEGGDDGILKGWLVRIAQRQRIQYCAISVKREVYETLGGFYGVRYGEDWEMWVRLAAHYPVAYTPEILAEYRRHQSSISGQAFLTGQNMRDIQWVIETIQRYLPPAERRKAKQKAVQFYAHYAVSTASRLWRKSGNKQGAKAQLHEALRMYKSRRLYWRAAKLYTRLFLGLR